MRKVAEATGTNFVEFLASGKFRIMTPEQVGRLPRSLVDVQLHTHRHRAPRDEILFKKEILDNRGSIARAAGAAECRHFCYPSGDYSQRFLAWLEDLGVSSATTCVAGLATRRSHPLLLPRFVDTMLMTDLAFASALDGTLSLLPRRRIHQLQERQ